MRNTVYETWVGTAAPERSAGGEPGARRAPGDEVDSLFQAAISRPSRQCISGQEPGYCRGAKVFASDPHIRTLTGKMDASNPRAKTPAEYLGGTASFRTDLFAGPSSGTLITHKDSIALFKNLGVKITPELQSPSVPMPYDSDGDDDGVGEYTQENYAQQLIDKYRAAKVPAADVFAQSFNLADVLY
ncbi:hypothetical protein [uncultured Lamprocystis sp.]|uniref:hypothetical protein n=1 Tax=uncultured Lamprocystis sp. TaxID=543132 RepID=UPI0025F8CCF7|nr:hypothetical protein [uncultured Lamprocystis sp.]